eukprot:188745-Alexandrium_andersonii.AAC.1
MRPQNGSRNALSERRGVSGSRPLAVSGVWGRLEFRSDGQSAPSGSPVVRPIYFCSVAQPQRALRSPGEFRVAPVRTRGLEISSDSSGEPWMAADFLFMVPGQFRRVQEGSSGLSRVWGSPGEFQSEGESSPRARRSSKEPRGEPRRPLRRATTAKWLYDNLWSLDRPVEEPRKRHQARGSGAASLYKQSRNTQG